MYKYANSRLQATFIKYFKLIADVHPYDARQIKTGQFALQNARSNSGAKMIKFSSVEIWSKIPLEIKNKACLALFLSGTQKYVLLRYWKHYLCSFYWCT